MTETWWILLEVAVRAAFLGLAAGIALRLWHRRPAAVSHTIWAGVVVGMLALPLLTAMAPRLTLAVPAVAEAPAAGEAFSTPGAPASPGAAAALSVSTVGAPDTPAPAARRPGVVERLASVPWTGLLATLYLGVAACMLLSLARGAVVLRRLSRAARPVEDPGMLSLAAGLLPGRAVTIVSSPAVRVPLTAGFFRPRVFLPEGWRCWSDDKRCAVLAHELSHVRRGDFLWTLLAELNKCLYWFHPLAWIARRRLAAVAEEASDAAAAERLGSKTAYARVLVEVAGLLAGRQGRLAGALVAVPMASSNDLGRRVEQVLRPSRAAAVSRPGRRLPALAAACFALVVLLAGTIEMAARADVPEGPAAASSFDAAVADLGHGDPARRARAAYELSLDESRWDEAIPHLVALLGDDAAIRRAPQGQRTLGNGDRWSPSHLSWEGPSPGAVAVVGLASMSSRAAEPLVEALADGNPVVRRHAAWGLGELRHPRGIPDHGLDALARTLADPDASVRAAAAWSLGDIRVRRAIPRLIEALRDDPEPQVRALAAEALGEIRAAAAETPLTDAIRQDPDRGVRREARRALSEVIDHGF